MLKMVNTLKLVTMSFDFEEMKENEGYKIISEG
jgi:hypothetical protein